jgi:hypothetical protein
MYQRHAKMKPASMTHYDDPNIRLSSLIKFVRHAQKALEDRGAMDEAVNFECLGDYLEQDYKPGTTFEFKAHAIGL